MIPEPPNHDPLAVWQSHTDVAVPSLQEILARAAGFEAKTRRRSLFFWIAAALYLAVSITEDFAGVKGSIWWVGVIRFGLFVLWVLYIPFRTRAADEPLQTFSRLAGTTPVLEVYRRQLVRLREYFRDSYRGKLQAGLLAVGFIIYSIFYPTLFLIFGVPLALVGTVAFKRRRNEIFAIEREIETLDSLQKESQ